ncbi:MAG: undecaprenyldiphospho-muramoylpentapeptide beta-N-acetylglucosaminyltransferase [Bacteroidota bacterium]
MANYRFILSGGGTGGHIYPAIAIANELKARHKEAEFLFVGAKNRMEMEKVPQAGYRIEGLWISGLQRKLTLKNLMFPFKVLSSIMKARKIVADFKPNIIIGTGGYASGPVLRVAGGRKIPYVLQEQNSFAGITNKLLAKKAAKIFVAYDGMEQFFPSEKITKTGNPVRSNLVSSEGSKESATAFFGLDPNKSIVLIIGGSLGARRINMLIEEKLSYFEKQHVQLIWQCGKLYYEEYKKYDSTTVKVFDFLNRMDLTYAAADIIISRAGAGSVSELCIVGKPVLFIPSPNVAEDHQTKNAQALVDKEAAMMINERKLDAEFEKRFSTLLGSAEVAMKLSSNIKLLARPDATRKIADEIEKILNQ